LSNDNTQTNRFLNALKIKGELTHSICDWIRIEVLKNYNTTTAIIKHDNIGSTISYLEHFINNTVVIEMCSYYGIKLDQFSIVVYGYIYHKITKNDSLLKQEDNNFSMDIALTDVNGYYNFNNGTTCNLKKGDCIVYANMSQTEITNIKNDMPCILKTLIAIEPKKLKTKTVY
jgi:hypothetical protein